MRQFKTKTAFLVAGLGLLLSSIAAVNCDSVETAFDCQSGLHALPRLLRLVVRRRQLPQQLPLARRQRPQRPAGRRHLRVLHRRHVVLVGDVQLRRQLQQHRPVSLIQLKSSEGPANCGSFRFHRTLATACDQCHDRERDEDRDDVCHGHEIQLHLQSPSRPRLTMGPPAARVVVPMIPVPLPSAVVPIAPAPHVHVVASDPVVAAMAPFVVPADPDDSRPARADARRRAAAAGRADHGQAEARAIAPGPPRVKPPETSPAQPV